MKVWVNLNATFDLSHEIDRTAYDAIRKDVANAITTDAFDTLTFKTGEDIPIEDRKPYKSYSES